MGTLNPQELEIVKRICRGMPYRSIAEELGLATGTVGTKVSEIYVKLGIQGIAKLVKVALKRGWTRLDS